MEAEFNVGGVVQDNEHGTSEHGHTASISICSLGPKTPPIRLGLAKAKPTIHCLPSAMRIRIDNEWGALKRVIVGRGDDMGKTATVDTAFDPTSYSHLLGGTYPDAPDVAVQLRQLADVLVDCGVDVQHPRGIPELEQVFARDVGVVVEDRFFRSVMIGERQREWDGLTHLLDGLDIDVIPDHARMEGGDVLVLGDALVVGVTRDSELVRLKTARTNQEALDFLRSEFPNREVLGVELHKDDRNPMKCALHLDCAFMPLGKGEAIVCPDAFIHDDQLNRLMARFSHVIEISLTEAALLQSNLLHIDPNTLLIDPRFTRVSDILKQRGYRLINVPMHHTGKMGGLFRCTTLPLLRD